MGWSVNYVRGGSVRAGDGGVGLIAQQFVRLEGAPDGTACDGAACTAFRSPQRVGKYSW
jgi:hypothetical protein